MLLDRLTVNPLAVALTPGQVEPGARLQGRKMHCARRRKSLDFLPPGFDEIVVAGMPAVAPPPVE